MLSSHYCDKEAIEREAFGAGAQRDPKAFCMVAATALITGPCRHLLLFQILQGEVANRPDRFFITLE